jgi:hypothetical protein
MMRSSIAIFSNALSRSGRNYIYLERIGLLAGTKDPTPIERQLAEQDAERAYRNVLNAHRQLEFQVEGRAA